MFNVDVCRAVREAVPPGVAVFAAGLRRRSPGAEQAVRDGVCDGVEMTRAQIADPDLVAKLTAADVERYPPVHPLQPDVPGGATPAAPS